MEVIAISNLKPLYYKIFFISILVLSILFFNYSIFSELYQLSTISFEFFGEILTISPTIWNTLKSLSWFSLTVSWLFIGSSLSRVLFPSPIKTVPSHTISSTSQKLSLSIGYDISTHSLIRIPENGLYQNILITGTIGSGKTSSAMYPFVHQFLKQNIGMLILDVKGNFYSKVLELNQLYHREVIVIELNGKYCYNPLDKPNLKASVLANRLKTILTLFSNQNTSDSYWLDKVETYLTECIKLCRLYNNSYVTFLEIHKLINQTSYLNEKLDYLKKKFLSNQLTSLQLFDYNTCLDFFQNEYQHLDSKVLSIIQSEVSRITQIFVNDYDVSSTFCPPKEKVNFHGFQHMTSQVVVLNMNVAQYRNLSKIIAAYLKLDFQSEILMRLSSPTNISTLAFFCDEFQEYVTSNDCEFFAQSREAKCINIVSTQSYSSIFHTLKDQTATRVIIQNLVNKIWFRTDDIFTIEEAQKQLGKEDKVKISRSISENAKKTDFNYILNTFKSSDSNLSESVSTYIQHDFIYDFNTFSQELKTFHAICFLSNGVQILPPCILRLSPIHETTLSIPISKDSITSNKFI